MINNHCSLHLISSTIDGAGYVILGIHLCVGLLARLHNKKPSCRWDSRPYWLSLTFKVIQGQ